MSYITDERLISFSPEVRLTVRSSAWQRLENAVDPDVQALVLVWGAYNPDDEPGWTGAILPHNNLPRTRSSEPYVALLERFPVVVPQPQHLDKLNGRMLEWSETRFEVV